MAGAHTSTPICENRAIPVQNRFIPLQQWSTCDQTPLDNNGYSTRFVNNSPPNSNTVIFTDQASKNCARFSTLSMDDKLSLMFTKLEKLDRNDEQIMQMSSILNHTITRVTRIESCLDKHSVYLKKLAYHSIDQEARSRRNNLIFYGLADVQNEDTYRLLRQFIIDHLDLDLDEICIQRVHRLGSISKAKSFSQVPRRPIIAAFRDYQDTEIILENAYKLYGTKFGIDRDYPKEIAQARKSLWEYQKATCSNRDRVKILYPAKLAVNGKVVKDEFPDWFEVLNQDRLEYFRTPARNIPSPVQPAPRQTRSPARNIHSHSVYSVDTVDNDHSETNIKTTSTRSTQQNVNTNTCAGINVPNYGPVHNLSEEEFPSLTSVGQANNSSGFQRRADDFVQVNGNQSSMNDH